MKKEKVNFFERLEITDPEYAQKLYDKEEKKLKLKLICTAIAAVGSIGGAYCFTNVRSSGFLFNLLGFFWIAGMVAIIVAGSFKNLLNIILKFGKIAYYIIPFPLIDIFCFIFGAAIGFIACMVLPVIPCGITLYQSYKNINEAKNYLASYYHTSSQSTENNKTL